MAAGPKTTVRLTPIVRAYLDDLARIGAYGKGRAGVMRLFIERGVRDAIEKKVIAPKDVSEGVLQIGDARLACAVLDDKDNTRVFSQEGFLTAIGRAGKAKGGQGASVDGSPAFLRAQNLEPFISNELIESTVPLEFIPWKGPGYKAPSGPLVFSKGTSPQFQKGPEGMERGQYRHLHQTMLKTSGAVLGS